MTEFTVRLTNRPGMLAMLAERIASAGINLEALAAYGIAEEGRVHLMVDDAATARSVLRRAGLSFDEREVLVTTLAHEPGAVAAMARPLLIDGRNFVDPSAAARAGLEYEGIGLGDDVPAPVAG